jgi:hypothetical protein
MSVLRRLGRGQRVPSLLAEPLPPLPPALRFFPVHLILAMVDIIRKRHRDLVTPEDLSWETLRMSDERWPHTHKPR